MATGTGPGDRVECRVGDCGVVVFHPEGGVLAGAPLVFGPVPEVTLTPSTGLTDGAAIAVSGSGLPTAPATGLADGEVVQVTGADLMATSPGPPVLGMPTAAWAPTRCDAAVLDDPGYPARPRSEAVASPAWEISRRSRGGWPTRSTAGPTCWSTCRTRSTPTRS